MKNKQFFSIGLYFDGLKQLRVMGIIMLVLVGFVSYTACFMEGGLRTVYMLSIFSFTVFAPIMTLYLFGFTTSRKSSDVFHMMPYTRTCLYLSYVLAIYTWIALIIMVDIFGYFIVNRKLDFVNGKYILMLVICNFVMVSVINVAQGLTGTLLTNVVVTMIILFVPRAIINYVLEYINVFCPYVDIGCLGFPYGRDTNLIFGTMTGMISLNEITGYSGIIYTFILGAIYFTIAIILFNKRKSEMAERPAINRGAQTIIRSTIVLMICLIPLSEILNEVKKENPFNNYGFDYLDVLWIVIWYIFALFGWFLYELMSTKKVKNLLKTIPGLIVLVILNFLIIFCVVWSSKKLKALRLMLVKLTI